MTRLEDFKLDVPSVLGYRELLKSNKSRVPPFWHKVVTKDAIDDDILFKIYQEYTGRFHVDHTYCIYFEKEDEAVLFSISHS